MGYSSRKPYNAWGGPRKFFSSPSRHLKESNAKESSFEKPYKTKIYNEMHQEPNIPAVPDGALDPGGITVSFVDGACSYGIKAVAGAEIPTWGGPEEDKAGWLAPSFSQGAMISWKVSEAGNRRLDIVVDETKTVHVVLLQFKDGWGYLHTLTITLTCFGLWINPSSAEWTNISDPFICNLLDSGPETIEYFEENPLQNSGNEAQIFVPQLPSLSYTPYYVDIPPFGPVSQPYTAIRAGFLIDSTLGYGVRFYVRRFFSDTGVGSYHITSVLDTATITTVVSEGDYYLKIIGGSAPKFYYSANGEDWTLQREPSSSEVIGPLKQEVYLFWDADAPTAITMSNFLYTG